VVFNFYTVGVVIRDRRIGSWWRGLVVSSPLGRSWS
jgi:hypothetical protein